MPNLACGIYPLELMKYLFVLPLLLLLAGCFDENVENPLDDDDPSLKVQQSHKLKDIPYNLDTFNKEAIINYNETRIYNYCNSVINRLSSYNKKPAESSDFDEEYGFTFTKKTMDSLQYFGYSASDTTQTDNERKEIMLIGSDALKEKGIFEKIKLNTRNLKIKHPLLYARGVEIFLANETPHISQVTVKNEGSNFAEYTLKVHLQGGDDEIITYGIFNINNRLAIKMESFELDKEAPKPSVDPPDPSFQEIP